MARTISSRTPEGNPSRCSVCGSAIVVEASYPPGDATCANCGSLLWQREELLDFLIADAFLPEVHNCTQRQVLERMLNALAATGAIMANQVPEIIDLVLQRESWGTTGLGRGVAAPHAVVPGLTRAIGCVARSSPGIQWESLDKKTVHLIVLLLSPADDSSNHVRRLERLSRWLLAHRDD